MDSVWLTILERFGLPILILLAMGLFLWKGVWPFMMEQIRMSQESRDKALNAFTQSLKETNDAHRQTVGQIVDSIDRLTDEMRRNHNH